jgi:hypothetical protein
VPDSATLNTTHFLLYHPLIYQSTCKHTFITSIPVPTRLTYALQNWQTLTQNNSTFFAITFFILVINSTAMKLMPTNLQCIFPSIASLTSSITLTRYHETHLPDLFNHPDIFSTTSILSSLLINNPLTSLALCSLPHHHPYNCLSNINYSFLLQCKLCISPLPSNTHLLTSFVALTLTLLVTIFSIVIVIPN